MGGGCFDVATEQLWAILQAVKFSIFALGNKQYEHFAAFGKRVQECMLQLGAVEVAPRGDGDDDEDIDEDFEKWKELLLTKLEEQKIFVAEVSSCCWSAFLHKATIALCLSRGPSPLLLLPCAIWASACSLRPLLPTTIVFSKKQSGTDAPDLQKNAQESIAVLVSFSWRLYPR